MSAKFVYDLFEIKVTRTLGWAHDKELYSAPQTF